MKNYVSIAALVFVVASFVAAVVAYVLSVGSHRAVGALLLASGVVAAIAAQQVAEGHRLAHQRFALLPQAPNLRPVTVVIWGCGIAILGALMQFEV